MNRGRSEREIVFENTPKKTTADVTHRWSSELGTAKVLCTESEMFMHAKADAQTRVATRPSFTQFNSPQPRRASQGSGEVSWSVSESPQLPKVRRAFSMNAAMTRSILFAEPAYVPPLPRLPDTPPEVTESPTRKRVPEETGETDSTDEFANDWLTSWLPCCIGRVDPEMKKVY